MTAARSLFADSFCRQLTEWLGRERLLLQSRPQRNYCQQADGLHHRSEIWTNYPARRALHTNTSLRTVRVVRKAFHHRLCRATEIDCEPVEK
jgi:hypothetical protein